MAEQMRIDEHAAKMAAARAPLYHRYPGQTGPQDAYVEIDPEAGTLSASYNGEIGTAVPMDVWHGRRMRPSVTCYITGARLADLLAQILPLAQRVADGYDAHWDGSNTVGRLTDDAAEALEAIRDQCEAEAEGDPTELAQVWDVSEWLRPAVHVDAEHGRVSVGNDIIITKRTGSRRLAQLAATLEREAEADDIVLDGDVETALRYYQERL